jgi:acetaldehyde dehydrogenase (acetylating)
VRIARAISYLGGMAHGFAIYVNNPVKQLISMLYEIIFI